MHFGFRGNELDAWLHLQGKDPWLGRRSRKQQLSLHLRRRSFSGTARAHVHPRTQTACDPDKSEEEKTEIRLEKSRDEGVKKGGINGRQGRERSADIKRTKSQNDLGEKEDRCKDRM